ncbi:hypothetical protein N7456_000330 [Penicillium angulare]|uniref:F-box domain-containing protein n=1 Tax=Penicillium angulare TaxID=116970 RepID=A0A9W9KQU1_9EURO|nr:hypothetical protein N7456_000330 [Penicillium angulare]
MLSLLDLPPEILSLIIQHTIPIGFEAIALSCKTTYAASAHFQSQYHLRRKRFRNFKFSHEIGKSPGIIPEPDSAECWDEVTQETGICITTARGLLEHIAQDLSVAEYIHLIELNLDEYEEDENVQNSLRPEIPETLKELVRKSPIISAVGGNPEDWMEGIRYSIIDADIFLLTLLSQVRGLALRQMWNDLDPDYNRDISEKPHLWPVVNKISEWANNPTEFPHAPLSKLSIIHSYAPSGYEEKVSLTPYTPFMAINSVSEVDLTSAVLLDDGYTGYAFNPRWDSYSPNLRKLVLNASVAGPEEIEQLLSRIPNLEIFEFSHETKWHGCGFNWNPAFFLDTVQDVCAGTLKELSVFVQDPSQWPEGPEVVLMDMTRFEKLAVLELDVDMLCGTKYDKSMQYDGVEPEDDEEDVGPAWPKLVEMLPASIEEVKLRLNSFMDEDLECISHTVEGLEDSRATKLPHLKKLGLFVCAQDDPLPEKALESLGAAKRCGFSIWKSFSSVPLL